MTDDVKKIKIREDESYLGRVRPGGWTNPTPRGRYDLAVVGGGPAGLAAAEAAARGGHSVALIERHRLGGNSLNAGSVPSKAIVSAGRAFADMRHAEDFGAAVSRNPKADFAAIAERMRRIRARIAAQSSAEMLASSGIDIFFGDARFAGPQSFVVGGVEISFAKAILATGARPMPPTDIPGLDAVGYRTSADIFDLPALPNRIAIIGGGPLGCEMAQALCRLGAHVSIIQDDPKFLPREERDAAEILSRCLARDGVEIRLNTTVTGARLENGVRVLETFNNEIRLDIEAELVLLSIGRIPNIEHLELDRGGVASDTKHGIIVDDSFQTSNPNVYAAGDVCLDLKFANAAIASARMASANALGGAAHSRQDMLVPWCTYCDPEIAHIGLHVFDAHELSVPIKSFTVMMHDIDRAITDSQDAGFVKIHIEDGTDRILGATIVAERASEMINEMAVVMGAGIGLGALSGVIHAYPAQSEGIMRAALAYVQQQKGTSCPKKPETDNSPIVSSSSPAPPRASAGPSPCALPRKAPNSD
ncbi:MAG: FAD-dependent oxidoreductase [Proteobacteria bacterium]|nr:FAD-dependent oxidoreductase [Pseudomonadota bacterium]